MSNKLYDILKWIALYLLPALGTLYFTLSGIWGFPYGEQIVGTITALDTFLGVILGISKASYNKRGEWCGKRYTSNGNSTWVKRNNQTIMDNSSDEKEIFKKHIGTLQNITQPNII